MSRAREGLFGPGWVCLTTRARSAEWILSHIFDRALCHAGYRAENVNVYDPSLSREGYVPSNVSVAPSPIEPHSIRACISNCWHSSAYASGEI